MVGPLCRERAVHDGADLAIEVPGARHFRDGLVFLPGQRGGHRILNRMPGNRRRAADADLSAAASGEPASRRRRDDGGQDAAFPFSIRLPPYGSCPEMHSIPSPALLPAGQRRPPLARARSQAPDFLCRKRGIPSWLIRRPRDIYGAVLYHLSGEPVSGLASNAAQERRRARLSDPAAAPSPFQTPTGTTPGGTRERPSKKALDDRRRANVDPCGRVGRGEALFLRGIAPAALR